MHKHTIALDHRISFVEDILPIIESENHNVLLKEIQVSGHLADELMHCQLVFISINTLRTIMLAAEFHSLFSSLAFIAIGEQSDYRQAYYSREFQTIKNQICVFLFYPLDAEEILGNIKRYLK